MKHELVNTADGSFTIFLPEMNEHFHSVNGAVTESKYVFCERGYLYHPSKNPVVFEAGFGTGLNCLVTALKAEQQERQTLYMAVENYPLDKNLIYKLEYGTIFGKMGDELFRAVHESEWEVPVRLSTFFTLLKMKADLISQNRIMPHQCDIIYFDAFGPDKQPEMWSEEIFSRLYELTSPGGVLVTYSAKGEIRRRLNRAGFRTEKLPGGPGKKEMLRGIK